MSALDLARWQFGTTTVYHFLFVPITIGLAWFLVVMQTKWHRTGDERWLRMTHFFGKLFLVNFALGVVTGIVQEFQFGMNWSDYSRYVGDVFGAPLAIEGLAAFFLESTFLGLWVFGWDKLPKRVHLATIWLVAIGTTASAYFILAANSWMQHPVGYRIDEAAGRAELTSIWAVLTNSTLLYAFPHTIAAALVTAGLLVLAVAAYHLLRAHDVEVFRPAAVLALGVSLVAGISVAGVGHFQAQLMTEQQPMKMAAAEALYETEQPASFSLFAVGAWTDNPGEHKVNLAVPRALSLLSTNSLDGRVEGIDDIQRRYEAQYGPGNYVPTVGIAYWTFRLMVGAGFAMIALAAIGLWLAWRGRLERTRWFLRLAIPAAALPFVANASGWLFTELGRQPWVVQGLLRTEQAVSPSVGPWSVGLTLGGFTIVYGVLAAIEGWLMFRFAREGVDREEAPAPLAVPV